jgi:hypothetical protein
MRSSTRYIHIKRLWRISAENAVIGKPVVRFISFIKDSLRLRSGETIRHFRGSGIPY